MLEKLGGRKFLGFLVCLIAGIIVELASTKGLSSNLMTLMLGLLASFSASNVVATFKGSPTADQSLETTSTEPQAPTIDDARAQVLDAKIINLEAQNQALTDAVVRLQQIAQQFLNKA